ncbi:hypothetical protein BVI2075_160049 [Burkholderia vietnamiensis]|nr:hypothetical protein BVI2075_160049 [Burkholderia vietnamiensis]
MLPPSNYLSGHIRTDERCEHSEWHWT